MTKRPRRWPRVTRSVAKGRASTAPHWEPELRGGKLHASWDFSERGRARATRWYRWSCR